MKRSVPILIIVLCLVLSACGSQDDRGGSSLGGGATTGNEGETGSGDIISLTGTPFDGYETGDHFAWGYFIRDEYMSTTVTTLPVPLFPAYFTSDEVEEIKAGVEIANDAIGFDMYEVVDSWTSDARSIYKVDEIGFDDEEVEGQDLTNVVGYTYTRNIYPFDAYHAGRVVTDFAIEIRSDFVDQYVVAHELGHAMGIQEHMLIDYENDTLVELENHSLMASVITLIDPAMDDYDYMMDMQGQILDDYGAVEK